ncbi:IclR family transcriptional regulator [Amycolatopsis nigrescens]|uniref:IclR family transcriptional regulator n=1 Tax=Amycolatopsis nigrescens TaxID=381445 RepID=UPI00037CB19E|nr:helix-turn-helix domain-containing protein [Amycolatopsis nigrescens]
MRENTAGGDLGRTAGRGVLEGAFSLLEGLAKEGEAGLTRLAADAGLPKATAHRLLDQLVELGAVQRRSGRYRMGARMFRLGQAWRPTPVLRAAAKHPLRQLATATGKASVCVAVPDQDKTLIVGGMRGEVDEVLPLRAGLLIPRGTAADMLFEMETPSTASPERYSVPEWKRLIATARNEGLAFGYEGAVPSVYCVAAPVCSPSGQVVAAVGASVFDSLRMKAIGPAVQRAADLVSANLARLPEPEPAVASVPEAG